MPRFANLANKAGGSGIFHLFLIDFSLFMPTLFTIFFSSSICI
jgi:hypothetical protein